MPIISPQKGKVEGSADYGIPDISKLPSLIGVFDFHKDWLEFDANGKIVAINEATGKGIRLALQPKSVAPDFTTTLGTETDFDHGLWPPASGAGASFGPIPTPGNPAITIAAITSRPTMPNSSEYYVGWGGTTNAIYMNTAQHRASWKGGVTWTQNHLVYGDDKPEYMIFRGDATRASIITATSNEEVAITNTATLPASMYIGAHYADASFGSCWRGGAHYGYAVATAYYENGSRELALLHEYCKAFASVR